MTATASASLAATDGPSGTLFLRTRACRSDTYLFILKVVLAVALGAAGGVLALRQSSWLAGIGIVLLAAMYTHIVELQHQCLHHSVFPKARLHRVLGIPLGLPMLVCYSHYRVRHLQHHRYLGTALDTEFFRFDMRKPPTPWLLLINMFDFWRLALVVRDVWRSGRGSWQYGQGQIGDRCRRQIMTEYRLIGLLILLATGLSLSAGWPVIVRLWLLPLVVATPMHFLVELPEHILCDNDETDVLRNTRSITGSWFSTWFTNGNNFHVEHHAAMVVPLNRLAARHGEVQSTGKYVEPTYLRAYLCVLRAAFRRTVNHDASS